MSQTPPPEVIQQAVEFASLGRMQMLGIEETIRALPESAERTRLERLQLVHHNHLNKAVTALAGLWGIPVETLSGGTEK